MPLFPLGNVSVGLAVVYAGLAVFGLALAWREPRAGLFVALGPLLAPIAALGLLPLAAQSLRSPLRRAVATGSAVLLAAIVAGIRHVALPFDGASAPLGLGLAGSESPGAVAAELWRALAAQPTLGLEALVLAGAAAAGIVLWLVAVPQYLPEFLFKVAPVLSAGTGLFENHSPGGTVIMPLQDWRRRRLCKAVCSLIFARHSLPSATGRYWPRPRPN